jgi:hypothetical protein
VNLTHKQIVENAETRLLEALVSNNRTELAKILHPEVVFTDESGQSYAGFENIPHLNGEILDVQSCEISNRSIALFTNIAVVNCVERRCGTYRGISFECTLRITRSWKFSGRQWQLISTSLVLLPEAKVDSLQ